MGKTPMGKPMQSVRDWNPIHMQGCGLGWDSNGGPKRSQAGKEKYSENKLRN